MSEKNVKKTNARNLESYFIFREKKITGSHEQKKLKKWNTNFDDCTNMNVNFKKGHKRLE